LALLWHGLCSPTHFHFDSTTRPVVADPQSALKAFNAQHHPGHWSGMDGVRNRCAPLALTLRQPQALANHSWIAIPIDGTFAILRGISCYRMYAYPLCIKRGIRRGTNPEALKRLRIPSQALRHGSEQRLGGSGFLPRRACIPTNF
jgi:hypothetical protein